MSFRKMHFLFKALAKRLMIFCHLAPLRVAECRLYQMEDSQVRNLVTDRISALAALAFPIHRTIVT